MADEEVLQLKRAGGLDYQQPPPVLKKKLERLYAALRELSEEVGLFLSHDHVIGRLDDFTTRSGFIILEPLKRVGSFFIS